MYVAAGFRRVARTFQELRVYREVAKLLLARLVYNDGLVVIFSLRGHLRGQRLRAGDRARSS
jgi:MFS-type transporter involved in bile tolerance (Atg22 family)